MDYSDHYKEINKRMDYLKKFYPFFKVYTSYTVQKLDYDAPYLALDILTLLIEKGRLLGRSVPLEEIEKHIQKTLSEIYPDKMLDVQEVTRSILGLLETDTQGMLYQYQYFDPIRKRHVDEYIHLIEYDVKDGAYRITDTGLDFMISIKELPEESKISVSLILFKKQIESGSFRSALATIRELNLAVQLKKRKKEELLEKLMNGGFDVVEDFEKYTQEVLSQLRHEHDLFTQVHLLLKDLSENKDKIANNPEFSGKEEEFIVIKEIEIAVEHGYNIHNGLLEEFTDFPEEFERIYRIRLNSLFEKRYQFQEALENHIRDNLLNDVHILTILPLLYPRVQKSFNLLKIFEPQTISGRKIDIIDTRSKEEWTDKKLIDATVEERQASNFKIYATILMIALSKKTPLILSEYLDSINQKMGKDGLENVDLIPFLLELNSSPEIHHIRDEVENTEEQNPFEKIFNLSNIRNMNSRNDQIEESLRFACDEASLNSSLLRVISEPTSQITINGNDEVHISNMIFKVE